MHVEISVVKITVTIRLGQDTGSIKSESENSDPTGDRARTKLKKSKLAGRDSGCATGL